MADERQKVGDRWGTQPVEPSNAATTAATGRGGGIDPATHTVDTTPGVHTGREDARYKQSQDGDTMDRMQHQAREMTDRAEYTAHEVADKAQQKAGHLADKARHQVTSQLSSQKDRATEGLGEVSDALRQTSRSLRDKDQKMTAGYLDDAAGYVDEFSGYLRNHSVNDMLDQAQQLARREPSLFIGGAFVLGLLGSRFLKSSTPSPQNYGGGGYGGSYQGGRSGYRSQARPEYGSYVPGGVAGDYTRTHASEQHRTGSAAERALGTADAPSYSQEREENQ